MPGHEMPDPSDERLGGSYAPNNPTPDMVDDKGVLDPFGLPESNGEQGSDHLGGNLFDSSEFF